MTEDIPKSKLYHLAMELLVKYYIKFVPKHLARIEDTSDILPDDDVQGINSCAI